MFLDRYIIKNLFFAKCFLSSFFQIWALLEDWCLAMPTTQQPRTASGRPPPPILRSAHPAECHSTRAKRGNCWTRAVIRGATLACSKDWSVLSALYLRVRHSFLSFSFGVRQFIDMWYDNPFTIWGKQKIYKGDFEIFFWWGLGLPY